VLRPWAGFLQPDAIDNHSMRSTEANEPAHFAERKQPECTIRLIRSNPLPPPVVGERQVHEEHQTET